MEDQPKLSQIWWQKHKQALIIATVVIVGIIVLVIAFTLAVSWFGSDWTGFSGGESKVIKTPQGTNTEYSPGKTLWDWMQLLIIPVVLGIGGFWLSQIQKSNEQRTTTDNQREAALQGYIDKISELLLKEHLGELKPEYEKVQEIARARTLTVLPQLDADRKLSLVRFLAEARLLGIIRLNDVDLSGINLHDIVLSNFKFRDANLTHAVLKNSMLDHLDLSNSDISHSDISHSSLTYSDLSHVNLSHAKIAYMDLSNSSLVSANLSDAELIHVDLSGADLSGADLKGAKITKEQLAKAKSLHGTIMPDGSKHR